MVYTACNIAPQGRKAADRPERLALGLAVIQQATEILGIAADQGTLDDLRSKALARYVYAKSAVDHYAFHTRIDLPLWSQG